MGKMRWLSGVVAVAAIGMAFSLAPRTASAIALGPGGSCVADFTAAAGAQSGTGSYASACGDTNLDPGASNTLFNVITGLDPLRDDPNDWQVMSGAYGVFNDTGGKEATFLMALAANNHTFGWSDAATATERNVIIPSTEGASAGQVVAFSADEAFLLYAENTTNSQTGNVFFSDRSFNSFAGVDNFVHFLILEGDFGFGLEYLIIVEDQVTGCNPALISSNCGIQDDDFNDAGILLQSVPEPATIALFGAGLLGLGLYRRRRTA